MVAVIASAVMFCTKRDGGRIREISDLSREGLCGTLQYRVKLRTRRTDEFESTLDTWDYELASGHASCFRDLSAELLLTLPPMAAVTPGTGHR